jgi:cytochrome b561
MITLNPINTLEKADRDRGSAAHAPKARNRSEIQARVSGWKSTPYRYGRVAVAIHWASALLIAALLASGFRAANTLDPAAKAAILRAHAVIGLAILALTLARLGWWFIDAKPGIVAGTRPFMSRAAGSVHALLYIVVLGMAASGIGLLALSGAGTLLLAGAPGTLPDFWAYPPRVPHGIGARMLVALIVLHTVAAFYHQVVKRDGLLGRMWLR